MSSWSGDIANEDSATEALILQLIAEDFGISNREDPPDQAVDPEDELSGNEASSSADLDDRPYSRRGSVKSLDEHSIPDQSEHTLGVIGSTITQVQGLSPSTTPSHLEHPISINQTSNFDAGDPNTMPKRNVEAAELPVHSVDDPETFYRHSNSGMPPVNGALSIRPGRSTNENLQVNLQAPSTNPNKRPRVAGNSRSSSRQERPRHKDIVNHQATLSDHDSNFAQHHQHITTRNDHDSDMQLDKPLSQPYPGTQPSADEATTMNGWGGVRSELEGPQGLGNRHYNDHSETTLSSMQSQNTNVDQPRRAKEWKFREEHPQPTAKVPHRPADPNRRDPFGSNHKEVFQQRRAQNAGRPPNHDPFGSNHKYHPTQQAIRGGMRTGQPRRANDAIFDENSGDEAQYFKSQYPSNAISPYDDEWQDQTAEARASRMFSHARAAVDAGLRIHESTIRHEGKVWTYIQVPWAGKPGWMESYVDDTSYEAFHDPGDYGGRRYRGPTLGQLEDNRRRKTGEQPVDIFVGEDETLVGNFRAVASCSWSLARETCLTTTHLPRVENSDSKIYYRTA